MKILYISHIFYPESQTGTEKFVFNMAASAQKNGHAVKVITYSFYEDSSYDQSYGEVLAREFEYQNIPVIAFKCRNPLDMDDYALEHPKTRDYASHILEREKPDLVHVGHTMRTGEFVSACIQRKIPYVITLTDYFLICPKYIMLQNDGQICSGCHQGKACLKNCPDLGIDTAERYEKAGFFLKHARAITAPSEFVKKLFEQEINGIHVQVVNHGLELVDQRKNQKRYQKGDQITFGYIGSFCIHKGILSLFRVFSRITANLVMYGFTVDEVMQNLLFKKYNIRNIRIGGKYTRDQLAAILDTIDVLIVPSIWNETYCFAVYEGVVHGIPVIVSDGGALTEKIKNGVEGFIFEKNNLEQLEKIIHLVVENPQILNTLKGNIANFSIPALEDEAKIYSRIYEQSLAEDLQETGSHERELSTPATGLTSLELKLLTEIDGVNEAMAIGDEEWNDFIETHSDIIRKPLLFLLRYELDYLKSEYGTVEKECIIWGAGNSGTVTRMFIEHFLPNFKIAGYIDNFKEGYSQGVKIYKPDDIDNLKFDFAFIATTPGKKEACDKLAGLNLKAVEDYFWGYGVSAN